jgi:hypothetical protein
MSNPHIGTLVPNRGKTEEMSGGNPVAEAGASVFHPSFCVSLSPPPALEVTGDLDKEASRAGRSGNDLGAGFTGCGGIDERPREEGFFASLSPPIFGKTEVARELD